MAHGSGNVGHRIDIVLSEFRIIVPGLAALLGFQFTVAFSDGFARLPEPERWVHMAAVAANIAALVFLLIPPSYNRFTTGAEEDEGFLRYVKRSIHHAFVGIATTLVLSLYVQAYQVLGSRPIAGTFAAALAGAAALAWWVFPLRRAQAEHRRPGPTRRA